MEDIEVFKGLRGMDVDVVPSQLDPEAAIQLRKINEHRAWLRTIRHERPSFNKPYRIGVYIRYFNQTKYDDYLKYHMAQFVDDIGLCPLWTLVGFYIDTGASAPRMASAPEWSRLLDDCMDGKIDLIVTQKMSNVSKDPLELALCCRILAAQENPVGIYFISEDIFTSASYYQDDLHDTAFLPDANLKIAEHTTQEVDSDD